MFSTNTGKYKPEKTPYLNSFYRKSSSFIGYTLKTEIFAPTKSCAKVCITTFSSRDLLFIFLWLLICPTFLEICFFWATFFSMSHLKRRKLLRWELWETWNKRGFYSKFHLAVNNKFLSSLCNYKLVIRNNVPKKDMLEKLKTFLEF